MLEAVSAASRLLVVIDPFDECERLLSRLEDGGWTLRRCRLDAAAEQSGEVVLICLGERTLRQPRQLLELVRRRPAGWVALLHGQSLGRSDVRDWIDEWFCAAHALPVDSDVLLESLACARTVAHLHQGNTAQLLGDSSQTHALRKQLERCAGLSGPLLLSGERGSGKHLLARLLHERSPRATRPLLRFDCAAQPAEQLESSLFATLAATASGSLILEGVAALAGDAQLRLLQRLQAQPMPRLLTLSRGELEEAVRQGRVRDDLYHRLAEQRLQTTPLRDDHGELMLLAEHFATSYGTRLGRAHQGFSDEAIQAMGEHQWPGNVRELRNRIARAVVLTRGRQVLARDLGLELDQAADDLDVTLADYILRAERQALDDVLARYSSNMTRAARSLGISRPTFYRLLHKHRLR